MKDDEFQIRLTDVKAKFINAKEKHMAFVEADGQYQAAMNQFLKDNDIYPDKTGQFVMPDLIDKIANRRSGLVLP